MADRRGARGHALLIATVFEWQVREGHEAQFEASWAAVTRMLHGHGSHGSSLFINEEGHYCAIALWPDRATRDAAFAPFIAKPTDDHARMREAIGKEIRRMDLDCVSDLWRLGGHEKRG